MTARVCPRRLNTHCPASYAMGNVTWAGDDEDVVAFNKHDCPYAIPDAKTAIRERHDSKIEGNVVKVTHLEFGRTGNRFMAVIRNLALGYCCKSKQVNDSGIAALGA